MKQIIFGILTAGTLLLRAGASVQSDAAVANGKRLFVRDGCFQCHGYVGQGGIAGSRIGATPMNTQAFIQYVRRPSGAMPAYSDKVLSDQELADIHAYLKSMPAPKAAKDIPLLQQLKEKSQEPRK